MNSRKVNSEGEGLVFKRYKSFFFFELVLSMVRTTFPGSPTLKLLQSTGSSDEATFLAFCTITV
ncbi:hypothetical protein CR513_05517 [Mucuna pruriens]|uniref:Uncharacterized protein n=1 Tax=Mucuna pruriens TaxID=157652 RepID=A0A371I4Y1_MUCPR|nr:hypothetical protein CR513_05517 [Mucuna pruriens]